MARARPQYVESLLANVLDDSRNVFGFGYALVNGFAKLLDQLPQFLVQRLHSISALIS
jgi:hypothetical protein